MGPLHRRHLLALGLVAGGARAAGFSDPLDRPAQPSALSARALLLAVTRAGRRLVAVGQRGHILTSDDAGANWRQASVPVATDLTAVAFASPERGWAVGHDGVILHTRDGGLAWTRQMDGRSLAKLLPQAALRHAEADLPLMDVWFADERQGYAVGAYNLIVHTRDGGQRWEPWGDRTDNPQGLHLNAVRGDGAQVFIAGERGLVQRLDAAAGRFVPVPTGYGGSFFALLVRPQTVLALGMRGHLFRSTSQGRGWERVPLDAQAGMTGAAVLDDGRIVAVSQAGQVWTSRDDGASFEAQRAAVPMAVAGVAAVDARRLLLVGTQGARLQEIG